MKNLIHYFLYVPILLLFLLYILHNYFFLIYIYKNICIIKLHDTLIFMIYQNKENIFYFLKL